MRAQAQASRSRRRLRFKLKHRLRSRHGRAARRPRRRPSAARYSPPRASAPPGLFRQAASCLMHGEQCESAGNNAETLVRQPAQRRPGHRRLSGPREGAIRVRPVRPRQYPVLDALHERQRIKTIRCTTKKLRFMGSVTEWWQASRDLHVVRAGLDEYADRTGNAYLDSVPFLAVTGNMPTSQFNRGAFQELPAAPGRLSLHRARVCKRVFSRPAATGADHNPAGLEDDGDRTAWPGRARRAVRMFMEAAAEETPKPEEWNANISSRCGADPEGVTNRRHAARRRNGQ